MMEMLQVDRLYEAVAQRGPVCVGLDTCLLYTSCKQARRDL